MYICVCIDRWLVISVLSNRHSPTYESIRDYIYVLHFTIYETFAFHCQSSQLLLKSFVIPHLMRIPGVKDKAIKFYGVVSFIVFLVKEN